VQNDSLILPIEKWFGEGAKTEDLTTLGKSTPKEHTHHRNTFIDALSENPRFSG